MSPQDYYRMSKACSGFLDLKQLGVKPHCRSEYLSLFLKQNPHWWKQVSVELAWLKKKGFRLCVYGSSDYPERFYQLKFPPLIFSYLGEPLWLTHKCFAVVGSRSPSSETSDWVQTTLRSYLEGVRGQCLVSGGAIGIDQLAHQQALLTNTPTMAFLPSGFNCIYPRRFQPWVKTIVEQGGAVVSQFSPFQEMRKHLFLIRNELIATLSEATILVEGRRRSGSHMTTRLAVELGREVGTLPLGPKHPSQANNDMLFAGAMMLREPSDLVDLLR